MEDRTEGLVSLRAGLPLIAEPAEGRLALRRPVAVELRPGFLPMEMMCSRFQVALAGSKLHEDIRRGTAAQVTALVAAINSGVAAAFEQVWRKGPPTEGAELTDAEVVEVAGDAALCEVPLLLRDQARRLLVDYQEALPQEVLTWLESLAR